MLAAPYYFTSPVMASTVGKEIKKKTKRLVIRLVLLTVYLTSGAAIFSAIESDRSLNEKQVEVNLKVDEIKRNMTMRFNASENIIEQYVEDLRQLFQKHNVCRKYSHNNWSYYQSLYFAGSVTTTIGYGHLAPKRQGGRLFLIFFALFGIPLNLLTLQSVGEHINYGIHLIIKCFEKVVLKKETPAHQHIKCFAINLLLITLWLPLGGIMYYYSEKKIGWTFLDCVYYCFVALSTIGFGDLVPNEGKEPKSSYEQGMWIVRLMYLGMGLSLLSSVFTSVGSAAKQIQSLMPCKRETSYEVSVTVQRQSSTPKGIIVLRELTKLSTFCKRTTIRRKGSTRTSPVSGHLKLPERDSDTSRGSFCNSTLTASSVEDFEYSELNEMDNLSAVGLGETYSVQEHKSETEHSATETTK